jgi:hypothetical protein
MLNKQTIDRLWLVLVALTLGGAFIGEAADPGLAITMAITLTMAFKGRMVVDHFMGLKTANRTIRNLMHAYFYAVPLITVVTYVFGDWVARITTL